MNKWYIIAGAVILALIIAGIAGSSGSSGKPSKRSGHTCELTVTADLGADRIYVTNENTRSTIKLRSTDLPYTLFFNEDDVLTFLAITGQGYEFNVWELDDGSFPYDDNPLRLQPGEDFTIHALFLPLESEIIT